MRNEWTDHAPVNQSDFRGRVTDPQPHPVVIRMFHAYGFTFRSVIPAPRLVSRLGR